MRSPAITEQKAQRIMAALNTHGPLTCHRLCILLGCGYGTVSDILQSDPRFTRNSPARRTKWVLAGSLSTVTLWPKVQPIDPRVNPIHVPERKYPAAENGGQTSGCAGFGVSSAALVMLEAP